ncbi:MAG: MarR family transcriptional regulator [Bacteroidota bacterium]
MKPFETIEYPIRLVWTKISRLYNGEAAKYGTTMATGFILLNIDRNEGTPSTKLGPMLGLEPRSLVRTLSAMEEKGLILRKPDPLDKRMVRIHLTPFGIEKREVSKAAVVYLNKKIQQNIDPEKLTVFFEVLDELNQALDNQEFFSDLQYAG